MSLELQWEMFEMNNTRSTDETHTSYNTRTMMLGRRSLDYLVNPSLLPTLRRLFTPSLTGPLGPLGTPLKHKLADTKSRRGPLTLINGFPRLPPPHQSFLTQCVIKGPLPSTSI